MKVNNTEQADAHFKRPNAARQYVKRRKARREWRRANADPECQPAYGRYRGWLS